MVVKKYILTTYRIQINNEFRNSRIEGLYLYNYFPFLCSVKADLSFWCELNGAGIYGVEGVIRAAPNIFAGIEFCAALADYDIAGLYDFAAVKFDAEPFWLGVPAEAGWALCFSMSHKISL